MIYILLIITIVCFAISYLVLRDLFSPSCIISISYILSVFLAILNIDKWGINLESTTVFIITIGLISFIIPSIMITILNKVNYKKKHNVIIEESNEQEDSEKIYIDKRIVFLFIALEILTVIIYIYCMMKNLGTGLSIKNFSERMQSYRRLTMVDSESLFEIPFIVKQMLKLSKAFIYCYSFIIIYNCSLIKGKVNIRKNIPISLVISISVYAFQSIFSASRFNLAILFVYLFLTYYILFFSRKGKGSFKLKTIIKVSK